jgi:hypothetical protein
VRIAYKGIGFQSLPFGRRVVGFGKIIAFFLAIRADCENHKGNKPNQQADGCPVANQFLKERDKRAAYQSYNPEDEQRPYVFGLRAGQFLAFNSFGWKSKSQIQPQSEEQDRAGEKPGQIELQPNVDAEWYREDHERQEIAIQAAAGQQHFIGFEGKVERLHARGDGDFVAEEIPVAVDFFGDNKVEEADEGLALVRFVIIEVDFDFLGCGTKDNASALGDAAPASLGQFGKVHGFGPYQAVLGDAVFSNVERCPIVGKEDPDCDEQHEAPNSAEETSGRYFSIRRDIDNNGGNGENHHAQEEDKAEDTEVSIGFSRSEDLVHDWGSWFSDRGHGGLRTGESITVA